MDWRDNLGLNFYPQKNKIKLYKSLIRPVLAYGSETKKINLYSPQVDSHYEWPILTRAE